MRKYEQEEKIDIEKGGEIMEQNRFRSWALWTAVAALIVFCVKQFAGIDIGETMNGLLDVLLPVLVAFGIVNNPTDKKNF